MTTSPPPRPDPGTRHALGRLLGRLLRVWGWTWRISFEGPDPLRAGCGPAIGAMWHRNFLIATYVFRDRDICVPVSRSRDGEMVVGALDALGYGRPPRGSSSRGGTVALRDLTRLAEAGHTVAIQTDGPRGPAGLSKTGILTVARRSGNAITPVSFSADPCMRFRSWDRTLLPLPFARVTCRFGDPLVVSGERSSEREQAERRELDSRLAADADELDATHHLSP